MSTMRRVSILGDRLVSIGETNTPEPEADQVLVRIAVSALCGSEMRAYRGEGHPEHGNGGHEAAGVVVAVGSDVTELVDGDRVGLSAIVGCGLCEQCAAGRTTWCASRRFVGGMHADFVAIAARACHRLPDDVDWATGTLISGDGLGVPFHSLTKIPEDAATVAVFGLGPIGLGAVLLHAHLGRTVIGIDLAPERLALAQSFGAKAVVDSRPGTEETVTAVRALTANLGPDVCIEAAGLPVTTRACFDTVRTAGTVIFNGEQPRVELSPSEDFIRRDITASGAWFYHFREFGAMLDLVREGFPASTLVTHRLGFSEANKAFAAMDKGLTGKVLLEREWV